MAAAIDTAKVADRRTLRFADFAAVRAELDRLEGAQAAGRLRSVGNWTAGQIFAHLAAWMSYPYEGYPARVANPPWIVRFVVGFRRRRFLEGGMPAGVHIPTVPGGTLGQDALTFEDGLARLRRALDRMERVAPTAKNPLFGAMTHEEWMGLNLRHCELHLGFLVER